jgi:hypothetical protein
MYEMLPATIDSEADLKCVYAAHIQVPGNISIQ